MHFVTRRDGESASKESCGLRHPELVSGSEETNRQMLNQVQHDKMVKNRYKLKSALSVSSASKELENSKFKVQSSIFACMICLHDFFRRGFSVPSRCKSAFNRGSASLNRCVATFNLSTAHSRLTTDYFLYHRHLKNFLHHHHPEYSHLPSQKSPFSSSPYPIQSIPLHWVA